MTHFVEHSLTKEIQLCRVRPGDWNDAKSQVRPSHPDYKKLNERIKERLRKAEDEISEAERKIVPIAAATVIKSQRPRTDSFLDQVQDYINARKALGKLHTAEKYSGNLTILKLYLAKLKKKTLDIHEITEDWVLAFIAWERNRGTGPNTLNRRLEFLRSVMATYCRQEARRGRFVYNAFEAENCHVSRVKSRKAKLTPKEIEKLEGLLLPEKSRKHHARLCWLFQYYMRGIRISDALMMKRENIVGDRIEFTTIKSPTFHSVLMHPKLKRLVQQLLDMSPKREYLLPLMTWQPDPNLSSDENTSLMWRQIESKTQIVNKNLEKLETLLGVEKKIRSHVSRHSFAREADRKVPDKRKVQGMLGHSTFKNTENYLDDLREDEFDEYADQVFA